MNLPDEMHACIEACLKCHSTCLFMALNHCLPMGGKHVEPEHFKLMMACAEMCQTSANLCLSARTFTGAPAVYVPMSAMPVPQAVKMSAAWIPVSLHAGIVPHTAGQWPAERVPGRLVAGPDKLRVEWTCNGTLGPLSLSSGKA